MTAKISNHNRGVWMCLVALGLLTLFRLILAAWIPLSPDEAYYRLWALAPAAGYLDHPPMVALWMRIGMFFAGDTAEGLRFMGPVSAAIGTVLLVQAAQQWLQSQKLFAVSVGNGFVTALKPGIILNCTLAVGLGTLIMTPDTPLVFFMALLLWSVSNLLSGRHPAFWLLVGLSAGLGFDSKYTALLPVAGLGMWLLATRAGRQWLRTPWPWLGAVVAMGCMAPVVEWNATHHWVSFLKQGGRAGDWQPTRMFTFMGELLGGQVGLASPFIFVLFAVAIKYLLRLRDQFAQLLLCMVLLPAAVFLQHAIGARVQANWPVVLYPALALSVVCVPYRWWKAACALGAAMFVVVVVQALWAPAHLSPHFDMTLRQMGGWPEFVQTVEKQIPPDALLIADEYGLAGELSFYAQNRKVLAVEPRWQFFAFPHSTCGAEGYLLRSHRRHDQPDPALFDVLSQYPDISRSRRGSVADSYAVYRVRLRCLGGATVREDTAVLPANKC
ncbi:glycosyltransferase family 39 protein [Acetobacter pomorum]|nr:MULTISPECIES: glycosyltransferase family 39 protein [Acetobacter]ATI13063.1 glycosyl transferase [Acetobacter pomorum]AXC26822.1 glycosyl transferase [Acetobacter sp. JWB]KAA8429194.1 glycosyltransferase family 39 protein [Acetobacter pomorum]KAA8436292.1 glycosyltransferase family 39 protein [Acetobacter pomorum]KAA8449607.1 glycosyltransferase family 39 protein [Acetobacter pomorum]